MRTLIVFHLGDVGGPSRSLEGTASWLAELGEVTALFPEEGTATTAYRELADVAVAPYAALTYARGPGALTRAAVALMRDVRTLRQELRRRRPDLVVVVTTVLPAALLAARLSRIPTVVYAAEVYRQPWKQSRARTVWGRALARVTAGLAGAVVCCSQSVAGQFPATARRRVFVAYPPIDARYVSGDRAGERERHGLAAADPCIATVGNLSEGRSQDVAVRALAHIRREAADARLLVVGKPHPRAVDRAYAAAVRDLARDLGVADAVVFCRDADVADVYAAADIVVNPARFGESFGRVVAEALVAGRPVVASDVGAVREVIRPDVDGLLVPPNRPDRLAEAILRLWRDPVYAAQLVGAGACRVAERFGPGQDLPAWQRAVSLALRGR